MPNYIVRNTHVRANGKLHAPGKVVTISEQRAAHILAKGNLVLVEEAKGKKAKPAGNSDPSDLAGNSDPNKPAGGDPVKGD
jgi:hypothetical protein